MSIYILHIVSCLSSIVSQADIIRCRAVAASKRAVDGAVLTVVAALKSRKGPVPLPPPPTKTLPLWLAPTRTAVVQYSPSACLSFGLLGLVLIVLVAAALAKMGVLQAGIKSIVNGLNRRIQALHYALLVVVLSIIKALRVTVVTTVVTTALNALDLLFGLVVQLIAHGNQSLLLACVPADLAVTDLAPTLLKPIDSSYLDLPGPNALLDVLTFRPRSRPIDSLGVKHSVHIDEIRIVKELGRGGFGRVVRVETQDKTRQFALKKIKKIAIDWRSFRDEVGIHALMEDHPAFPSIHGVFHDCLHFFLIMDIAGESFEDFRMTSKAGALFFGAKLMAALHALHERGVVHHDIKPANLLLDENNTLRVIDYGVSQRFDLAGPTAAEFPRWCKLRDEGGTCFPMLWPGPENPHIVYGRGGTPAFMSPPDRHHLPSSYGSDIWALGVTMYEWITLGTYPNFAAVDGTWVANREHQLSTVEVDFFRRAFSWTAPHRFESWDEIRRHPMWTSA